MVQLLIYAESVLHQLEEKSPQYELNGDQNLWIVKPGQKSRGRGIEVFKNYDEMFEHMKKEKGTKWVVQKYIENPLIIEKKKFDLRQWVLVSDWNPLTVWAYAESYIRFAA